MVLDQQGMRGRISRLPGPVLDHTRLTHGCRHRIARVAPGCMALAITRGQFCIKLRAMFRRASAPLIKLSPAATTTSPPRKRSIHSMKAPQEVSCSRCRIEIKWKQEFHT